MINSRYQASTIDGLVGVFIERYPLLALVPRIEVEKEVVRLLDKLYENMVDGENNE